MFPRIEGAQIPNDLARLDRQAARCGYRDRQGAGSMRRALKRDHRRRYAHPLDSCGASGSSSGRNPRLARRQSLAANPGRRPWHLAADPSGWVRRHDPAAAEQDRRLQGSCATNCPGFCSGPSRARACLVPADGLTTPDGVQRAVEHARTGEDVLGQFLAERCAIESGRAHAAPGAATAYNLWAEANSERRTSSRLGAWLEERGYHKEHGSGNAVMVIGIRLR